MRNLKETMKLRHEHAFMCQQSALDAGMEAGFFVIGKSTESARSGNAMAGNDEREPVGAPCLADRASGCLDEAQEQLCIGFMGLVHAGSIKQNGAPVRGAAISIRQCGSYDSTKVSSRFLRNAGISTIAIPTTAIASMTPLIGSRTKTVASPREISIA